MNTKTQDILTTIGIVAALIAAVLIAVGIYMHNWSEDCEANGGYIQTVGSNPVTATTWCKYR